MSNLSELYIHKVLEQVPRLLAQLDRNPYSPTYGCFDWSYWHDKVLDIPSGHAQESVLVLALLYKNSFPGNIYYKNKNIKEWLINSILFWSKIQHKDGSIDEFYKNERQFGATAIVLWSVLESYILIKHEIPDSKKKIILNSAYKSALWLINNDESSILANHQTQALMALHKAYQIFDEDILRKGISEKLNRIYSIQSQDGWLEEYGGPDLGYLTTSISFLAKYYNETRDVKILDILEKAITFLSYFIYPDGSFGGVIGYRNTAHFWPHGFEILASEIAVAGRIAEAGLEGFRNRKMVMPQDEDRYFSEQMYDFIYAYLDYSPRTEFEKLPHEKEDFSRYFMDSNILVHKKNKIYLVINAKKGGIIKYFENSRLMFSDCGFLGELENGTIITSTGISNNNRVEYSDDSIIIEGQFHRVNFSLSSPIKKSFFSLFLSFFALNTYLSSLIKNTLSAFLITKKVYLPIFFKRSIYFSNKLKVEDKIILKDKKIKFKKLTLIDNAKLIFVAYSKYFEPHELFSLPANISEEQIGYLNKNRLQEISRKIINETCDVWFL